MEARRHDHVGQPLSDASPRLLRPESGAPDASHHRRRRTAPRGLLNCSPMTAQASQLTILISHPAAESYKKYIAELFPQVRVINAVDQQVLERHIGDPHLRE